MVLNAPSKFRSIISVSNLKSGGLVSVANNSLSTTLPKSVLRSNFCNSGWVERSDFKTGFLDMAAPRGISELSEGITRLSASLAELNHEAQRLAKVNVHKLESVHSPGYLEKEDSAGMDVSRAEDVGKTDGNRKVELNVGKIESPDVLVTQERNVGKLEEDVAGNVALTASKSEEEETALREVLEKIRSGNFPSNVEGIQDNVQDLAEQEVGKTEAGNDVGKLEGFREPGGKLKEDVAKAMAEKDVRKAAIGKVGKTENDVGETQIGKVWKAEEDTDVGNLESRRVPGGKLKEDAVKGTLGTDLGKTQLGNLRKTSQGSDVGIVNVGKPNSQSKLEENVVNLHASFGQDGHAGIVGKTEGRDFGSSPGRFIGMAQTGKLQEGADANVGKPNSERTHSKLEDNVRKLHESFDDPGYAGLIGKTEGKEFVLSSFIEAKGPGKLEEGNESTSGRAECRCKEGKLQGNDGEAVSQNAPGKLEENVGKAGCQTAPGKLEENVGKAECQTAPGKLEENVGKAECQTVPGKRQENLGTVEGLVGKDVGKGRQVGKTEPNKHEEAETKSAENPLKNTESNVSGDHEISTTADDSAGKIKVAQKTDTCNSGKLDSGHVECIIHLASKGSAEAEYVEKLKKGDGLQVPAGAVVVAAAEFTSVNVKEVFDCQLFLKNLSTSRFGRLVLYSPLIPSTHTLLAENFHSLPAGTLSVAGAQLQGKGRAGNVWQSPKGCLMFSFTIQMVNGRQVPFLQYVVSLAVSEAVEENCKARGVPTPALRIKWPNDLYAKGIKVGGVLCTSSYRDKTFNIVVGVGLNVGNREPTTCLDALIQDLDGQATAIRQEELLAAIMFKFESLNSIFQDQGFLPLQDAYCGRWLHNGQSVELEEMKPGSSTVSRVSVTIRGLTSTGYLLAADDAGEEYELHPDGNSFDFLKGLVRQKLPA